MGGWDCIHHVEDRCEKVRGKSCNPGMKGCVLAGRFRFSNPEKNRPAGLRPPPRPPITDEGGNDDGTNQP